MANISKDPHSDSTDQPLDHPEQAAGSADGSPRFGRLLVVLILAVLLIVAITVGSETYFSG